MSIANMERAGPAATPEGDALDRSRLPRLKSVHDNVYEALASFATGIPRNTIAFITANAVTLNAIAIVSVGSASSAVVGPGERSEEPVGHRAEALRATQSGPPLVLLKGAQHVFVSCEPAGAAARLTTSLPSPDGGKPAAVDRECPSWLLCA
jgi:hypothetical protein